MIEAAAAEDDEVWVEGVRGLYGNFVYFLYNTRMYLFYTKKYGESHENPGGFKVVMHVARKPMECKDR